MADSTEDDLERILTEFEEQNERRPVDSEEALRGERAAWLGAFEVHREAVLRTELEELAWAVEQRGHHAWVDDVAPAPGTGDIAGIELKVLPVADRRTASKAPGLRLVPDLAERKVIAQVHHLTPDDDEPHVVATPPLDRLDAEAVRKLGTRLMDIVFLRTERVLDSKLEPQAGDWSPEQGGVIPEHGQSSDWLG